MKLFSYTKNKIVPEDPLWTLQLLWSLKILWRKERRWGYVMLFCKVVFRIQHISDRVHRHEKNKVIRLFNYNFIPIALKQDYSNHKT